MNDPTLRSKLLDLRTTVAHQIWLALVLCWFGIVLGVWSGLAQAEGSRSLYPVNATCGIASGNACRADLDISDPVGKYVNQVRRRAFLYVYAQAGEYIVLGSRNRSNGGDINVYNPQSFGTPGDETLPATTDFTCSGGSTQPGTHYFGAGRGTIATRAQELAGPNSADNTATVSNGFAPCAYRAPVPGIYGVLFTAATGGGSNPDGSINTPHIGATAASTNATVSAWDVTVRTTEKSTADLNGRLFTYAFMGYTGDNPRPVYFSLYYVTYDGYRYKQDLRGLDPNGFTLYANTLGFLDDGQPLYKDLRGNQALVTSIPSGVTTQPPQFPIFFSDISPSGANQAQVELVLNTLSIPLTPASPSLTAVSFSGHLGGSTTTTGVGGTFQFTTTNTITYQIVISRDGVDFNPENTNNRVLTGIAGTGTHTATWDGKDNSGANFPASATPYPFRVLGRNAEVHFPIIDAENNYGAGPTITRLNGTGAPDTTVYYDDRGYVTSSGTPVGTLNGTLCPTATPAAPSDPVSLIGVDSTTNYRNWATGGNANSDCAAGAGWGDAKALNLWTYYLTPQQSSTLNIESVNVDVATTVSVPGTATTGTTVQGTFSFANNGTDPATGVTYAMSLPAGLGTVTFANWPTCTPACTASYNNTTGVVTFSGGWPTTLAAGQSLTGMSFTYPAPASGSVTVTTGITTTSVETYAANNTATASTAIGQLNVFSGTVFNDLNSDGIFNAGDVGQSGVTVTLYKDTNGNGVWDSGDTTVGTATTAANGSYSFPSVRTGTFFARTTAGLPSGATLTTPTPQTATFVSGGSTDSGNDFGFKLAASALTMTKIANPAGNLAPGDTVTYTLNITNTSATPQTGIVVNDPAPTGTTYVNNSTVATGFVGATTSTTISDNFSGGNYSGGSGWGSNVWTENDNAGGTPAYSAGNVQLVNNDSGCPGGASASNYCLRMFTRPNNAVGNLIYRQVNLSAYTAATLDFDLAFTSGSNAQVVVEVSRNGGTTYPLTQLLTTTSTHWTIDISSYVSASTRIRFRLADDSSENTDTYFYADNVVITAQATSTTAATKDNISGGPNADLSNGVPPNLVVAGDNFRLANGQSMTVTYQATVNASGLPASIVNVASVSSTQTTTPVQASVTNGVVAAVIGGVAWVDTNSNHARDVGEPGLTNVQVALYSNGPDGQPNTADDVQVTTTLTGANGSYLFSNVTPDLYNVRYTPSTVPTGLTLGTGANPTGTITVDSTPGQSYLNNNFGFVNGATNGIIGDLVWSDADGDGVRDPGEPGLGGVTLRLWQDTNNNGVYDAGVDTQVATTTTAADGSYLFAGVTPGPYYVSSDVNGTLFGYSPTAPSSATAKVTVTAGSNLLGTDFGYRNNIATHSITDNIWYDADGDGVKDAGEGGVAGVTVNLLDGSGTVIATTVTDAAGNVSFTGVPNGTYTLAVTDTASKLTSYTGTTPAATAKQKTVAVNSGNVTGTSFGYNQPGAIGNQVFVDSNNNGVQDPGEPGISGVTVRLYNSSGDQIATTTTAVDGSYLFTGRPAGNYTVKIDSTQSALGGYSPLNGTSNGNDREIAVNLATASSSSLAADFRYSSPSSVSVSGTIWSDTNRNANLETGEPGLGGVTVVLLNSGGSVVATTTTNSSGAYTFNNVPNGSYTVKVTDTSGLLLNYSSTTTGGDTQGVTVSGAVVAGINFGYYKPTPTHALLSDFRAYALSGVPVVEWQTSGEIGTVGFDLYRKDVNQPDESAFVQLNAEMLPALIDAPQGGAYYFVDHGAQIGQTYTYRLVEHEVDAKGRDKERNLGVHTVRIEAQTPADANITLAELVDDYARTARAPSAQEATRSQAARNAKREAKAKKRQKKSSDLAKLYVKEPGLYRVDAAEMATLLNIDVKEAKKQIGKYGYRLTSQSRDVAYHAADDNSALYFYNPGYDSVYTSTNVFWLGLGKKAGVPMAVVDGVPSTKPKQPQPPVPTGAETFQRTLEFEENHSPVLGFGLHGPEDDYWMWNYLYAGQPGLTAKTYALAAPGALASSAATLTLELVGGTNTTANPDHHLVVALNGNPVGETRWDGIAKQTLDLALDPGALRAGDNTLTLTALKDAGVPYSLFYLDRFTLKYSSQYQAANDRLAFNSAANSAIQISGFSTAPVVVSLSDPWNPVWVNVNGQAVAGGYGVTFNPASANTPYWAAAASAVPEVENAWTDALSQLKDVPLDADYLVIAPEEVKPAAQALADYRKTKGFSTAVVDLEDIMDEFNHGLSSPKAIRDFLTHAYRQWKVSPQFVVLAGAGSYDYQNYLGYNDSLIPPLLVQTPYGLAASDNHLGDVAGDDSLPDITIGRIPAVNNAELQAYVDKVKAYEGAGAESWAQQIVFVADNADAGGNFPVDSDDLAALVPAANQTRRVYLGTAPYQTASLARAGVLNALNQGAAYFNYLGHGNPSQLANEKLLLQSDAAGLTNGGRLPVALFLTCSAANFSLPGYDSLGEMLVLKGSGGAAAVWGPTGLSLNSDAKQLADGFFAETFRMGNRVLGEAVAGAYQHYGADHSRFMLDIYTILGDPALQMK